MKQYSWDKSIEPMLGQNIHDNKIHWYLLEMANTKRNAKTYILLFRYFYRNEKIAYFVVSRLLGIVIRLSESELYAFIMWFETADKRKTKPLNRLFKFNNFFLLFSNYYFFLFILNYHSSHENWIVLFWIFKGREICC